MISVQLDNRRATECNWLPLRQFFADMMSEYSRVGNSEVVERFARDDRSFRFYDV